MSNLRKTAAALRAELQRKRDMGAAQLKEWEEEQKTRMGEQEAESDEEIEKSLGLPREHLRHIPENQAGASVAREASQQQARGPVQQGCGAASSAERIENSDDADAMSVDERSDLTDEEGASKQWAILQGDDRCDACRAQQINCKVDWKPIREWRKAVQLGRVPVRAPAGTGCQRCQTKKHSCKLPATKDLWEASKMKRTAAAALSGLTLNEKGEQRPAKRARLDATDSDDFPSYIIQGMEAKHNLLWQIHQMLQTVLAAVEK